MKTKTNTANMNLIQLTAMSQPGLSLAKRNLDLQYVKLKA